MSKSIENEPNLDEVNNFYNYRHLPPKPVICSKNPSKVQESPLDAKSPQEVLEQHGMYKEPSAYAKNPEKIYMDLTTFSDYETQLNNVISMRNKFNSMDPDVKARFNNDPVEFCNYISQKDFDIKKCLTDKEYDNYLLYKKDIENQKAYDAYLKSDEFKALQAEELRRQAYEQAKYEEWKKNNGGSIK
jgi:hypothetical protein